jgi:hypothetical protein
VHFVHLLSHCFLHQFLLDIYTCTLSTPTPSDSAFSDSTLLRWQLHIMNSPSTALTYLDEAAPSKKMKLQPNKDDTDETRTPQPQESKAAEHNRRTIKHLQTVLQRDPEADLQEHFPKNYAHRMRVAGGPSTAIRDAAAAKKPRDFRERLDASKDATVLFPLSGEVSSLLARYAEDSDRSGRALLASLKQLVWESTKLWEFPSRGVVVKCSDQVVAKVFTGTGDNTEYSALQYLADKMPDIPAPRPHGLIEFKPFRAIFMSYISSMTLEEAWPSLSHESKLSVQSQLDDIFRHLRSHTQEHGLPMGGLGGEGVKDWRFGDEPHAEAIRDAKRLEELQFSVRNLWGRTYPTFLRNFLTGLTPGSVVLTHGDFRPANVMVEIDGDNCVVKGIIDWEESGFYPEFFESFNMTRTLSMVDDNDWFLYLPESVVPSKYPVRWLVNCLWNILVRPF